MYIIVEDKSRDINHVKSSIEFQKLEELLNETLPNVTDYKNYWITQEISNFNNKQPFLTEIKQLTDNSILYLILKNSFMKYNKYNLYKIEKKDEVIAESATSNLYWLLLILLLIPMAVVLYFKFRKKESNYVEYVAEYRKHNLETTPIEDYVYNEIIYKPGEEEEKEELNLDVLQETEKLHDIEIKDILDLWKRQSKIVDENIEKIKINTLKENRLISIINFENYLKSALQEKFLSKDFDLLSKNYTSNYNVAKLAKNSYRNRSGCIYPYDQNRVRIPSNSSDKKERDSEIFDESDYFNGSYITGYDDSIRYIATQDPKSVTVCDFWTMVCCEKVNYIVDLSGPSQDKKVKRLIKRLRKK